MGSGKILKQAIRKYGKENFKRDIIYESESIQDLNEAEKYYMNYYNACNSDEFYNIAPGGTGGNTRLGYDDVQYKEYCKKFSLPGEANGMFGRTQSKESKRKNGDKTKERFEKDEAFREKHALAVKEAMKSVDKEKLAYENRARNVLLMCSICGREETLYPTQQMYCSECKKKYSRWKLSCMNKSH